MFSRLRAAVSSTSKAPISLEREFCQQGFVRVPQVLGADEVTAFRAAAIAALPPNAPPYKPQFSSTVLFQEPLRRLFLNSRLIGTLRALLGEDFVFINELALHDSNFSGWHSDTTSPEAKAGHEFHWAPTYLLVNVAMYLQDNGPNGGGLDVVPRSHLADDPLAITMRGGRVKDGYKGAVSIPSRAGDVIIFHQRLSHRASEMKRPASTDAERKLALFMIAGPNNASTRRYRQWLDEYAEMNSTARPAVPAAFLSFLEEAGLSII